MRTREIKIKCCVDDGRPQGKGFSSFSYCPLYDSGDDHCQMYGRSLKGVPFNERPEFCRVTKITIEEKNMIDKIKSWFTFSFVA
jgi:hypothetical protein